MKSRTTETPNELKRQGEELKKLRNKAKLTITQVTMMTGTPYTTWRNWEQGRSRTPQIAISYLQLWIEIRSITASRYDALIKNNVKWSRGR